MSNAYRHKAPQKKTSADLEELKRQKDAVTYRVLLIVVAGIISVFVLRILEALFNKASTSWATYYFFCGVAILGAVLLLAGLIYFAALLIAKGTIHARSIKLIISGLILGITGYLVFALGYYAFNYLVLFYPVCAAYFLIYYIFQHEFFLISLICGGNIYLLYDFSHRLNGGRSTRVIAVTIIAVVLGILIYFIVKKLAKNGGAFSVKGNKALVFKPNAIYFPVYITCGALILTALISILAGALAAYILMFVMIAFFIVAAVYYAIKLL